MNSSAADFHSGDGVQDLDSTLEGLEVGVLVRKDAESALVDAKADARMNVFLRGLEPSIAGSLCNRGCEYRQPGRMGGNTDLLEDIVKKSVVAVVVHSPRY